VNPTPPTNPPLLRCAAVVACRNEADLLSQHLPLWIAEGLEVVVIDHSSEDSTSDVAKTWLGRGVLAVQNLEWLGQFSLEQQLAAKESAIEGLDHDWVVHLDTDEWLHSPVEGETLQQALSRLAAGGANAVNFEEFVLLPLRRDQPAQHYYFFEPARQRLIRAWDRRCQFSNRGSGGHRLIQQGETAMQLAEENLVLRHRIVRNQADARRKYLNRRFQEKEVQRGWHRNRLRLSARQLSFPDAAELEQLIHPGQRQLDRRNPHRQHYWHWPEASKPKPSRSVVCLYGCEADADLLEAFYSSPPWELIRQRKDTLLLEVWGGSTTYDQFDGRRLTLNTPDTYEQLSLKTLQMLRWCSRNLRMKQLIKLDLTSIRYQGKQNINLMELSQWLQRRLVKPLQGGKHYDGLLHHTAPTQANILQWGRNKGVAVSPEAVFGINGRVPGFFSGKAYVLSRPLLRYIAGHGAPTAHEHVQYLNGAEDLMVGRLAERFQAAQAQSTLNS
jgi:hypothetical protein